MINQNMSGMRRPREFVNQSTNSMGQSQNISRKKNIRLGIILIFIIIFFIIISVAFIIIKGLGTKNFVKKGEWQAVFLSSGQTYFGKVTKENNQVVVLKNIYYLQSDMGLQKSGKDLSGQGEKFALIKLGKEIHGPIDEMFINRSAIDFIENLKDDSKLIKAIEDYEKK